MPDEVYYAAFSAAAISAPIGVPEVCFGSASSVTKRVTAAYRPGSANRPTDRRSGTFSTAGLLPDLLVEIIRLSHYLDNDNS